MTHFLSSPKLWRTNTCTTALRITLFPSSLAWLSLFLQSAPLLCDLMRWYIDIRVLLQVCVWVIVCFGGRLRLHGSNLVCNSKPDLLPTCRLIVAVLLSSLWCFPVHASHELRASFEFGHFQNKLYIPLGVVGLWAEGWNWGWAWQVAVRMSSGGAQLCQPSNRVTSSFRQSHTDWTNTPRTCGLIFFHLFHREPVQNVLTWQQHAVFKFWSGFVKL